jgi:hypothetical protein
VTLAYTPTTGWLVVTLNGLPEASSADVSVSGPRGFEQGFRLSGGRSRTLGALASGTYVVTGSDAPGFARPASQTLAVVRAETSRAALVYTPMPRRWPWYLLVVGLALFGIAARVAARNLRRARQTTVPHGVRIRPHRGPGTQVIYFDGERVAQVGRALTAPEVRLRPRSDLGRQTVADLQKSLVSEEVHDHA